MILFFYITWHLFKRKFNNFYKPNSKILGLNNLIPSNKNDLEKITCYEVDTQKI